MIEIIKIIRKIERLRKVIRLEGTPAIKEAWGEFEPHALNFLNGGVRDGTERQNDDDGRGPSSLG